MDEGMQRIIANRRSLGISGNDLHRGLEGPFMKGTAGCNGPVIVWGPAGCGKTRNAEKLRKHFGCDRIIDEWSRGDRRKLRSGDLVLTCDMMADDARAIRFDDAMGQIGYPA